MKITSVKVVAFDCDGVMFDSTQANIAYYNQILDHLHLSPMSREQFTYAHMHTVDETLAYLIPDAATLTAAQQYRRTMSYLPFIRYMIKEPHLDRLLDILRPTHKTAVATNRTDTMDRLLAEFKLDGLFDLVVTAGDVERPKPYPDVLLKVLEFFALSPDQTIYVGDSKLDELAAEAACIPLVAYRNRNLASGYHIDTLKDLEALLNL